MKMSKIYSRPRIKIPKINFNKTENSYERSKIRKKNLKSKKISVTIIILIGIFTARIMLNAVYPIFDTLCEAKAKSIATIISNEEATKVMKDYSYNELFTIEKDSEDNIKMIKSNIITINEINSAIAERIQKRINTTERENIEIALRKFYRI